MIVMDSAPTEVEDNGRGSDARAEEEELEGERGGDARDDHEVDSVA